MKNCCQLGIWCSYSQPTIVYKGYMCVSKKVTFSDYKSYTCLVFFHGKYKELCDKHKNCRDSHHPTWKTTLRVLPSKLLPCMCFSARLRYYNLSIAVFINPILIPSHGVSRFFHHTVFIAIVTIINTCLSGIGLTSSLILAYLNCHNNPLWCLLRLLSQSHRWDRRSQSDSVRKFTSGCVQALQLPGQHSYLPCYSSFYHQ